MINRNLNYYGYDRHTYNDCLDQIRTTNLKHAIILNTWFLLISLVFLVIRIYDSRAVDSVFRKFNLNGLDRVGTTIFWVFALIAIALEVYVLMCLKKPELNFHALPYLNILLLSLFAIFCSLAQPSKQATIFLVVLVLLSVLYIDTFFRMTIVFSLLCVAFVLFSLKGFQALRFQAKPVSIAYEDIFNIIMFFSLTLILHYTVQRTRMRQYVTYQSNLQITRELSINSSFDALTSLLNRGRFMSMAGEVLRGFDGEYIAVCLIDLDGFKQINDKLGHQMGDKAIQIAAESITKSLGIDFSDKWSFPERALRERLSFAGRLGGDEFIVLIRGESSASEVENHLNDLISSLNAVEFGELHGIHASIGVTEVTDKDRDIDKAYHRADKALYRSKESGKNQITFSSDMEEVGS